MKFESTRYASSGIRDPVGVPLLEQRLNNVSEVGQTGTPSIFQRRVASVHVRLQFLPPRRDIGVALRAVRSSIFPLVIAKAAVKLSPVKERRPYPLTVVFLGFLLGCPRESAADAPRWTVVARAPWRQTSCDRRRF